MYFQKESPLECPMCGGKLEYSIPLNAYFISSFTRKAIKFLFDGTIKLVASSRSSVNLNANKKFRKRDRESSA
jgi:hypothetical protein